jgi:hypothetical protein
MSRSRNRDNTSDRSCRFGKEVNREILFDNYNYPASDRKNKRNREQNQWKKSPHDPNEEM